MLAEADEELVVLNYSTASPHPDLGRKKTKRRKEAKKGKQRENVPYFHYKFLNFVTVVWQPPSCMKCRLFHPM